MLVWSWVLHGKVCFSSRSEVKKRNRFFFRSKPKEFFGKGSSYRLLVSRVIFLRTLYFKLIKQCTKSDRWTLDSTLEIERRFLKVLPWGRWSQLPTETSEDLLMVSKFWHLSVCCGAVKVFLKTSCTQRVRSLKKIILQTSIVDQLNLTVYGLAWRQRVQRAHEYEEHVVLSMNDLDEPEISQTRPSKILPQASSVAAWLRPEHRMPGVKTTELFQISAT